MRTLAHMTRICLFLSAGVFAWAQAISTSQIQGTVQDSTGLAVPAAEVKVTHTDTGAIRTIITGADGGYVLTNLPIGPYQLEVSKEGFAKYVQKGIVLQVAANPTVDVTLKVGSVSEQVMVQADAAMVETQATGVGAVIENQRILELPLNGRNAADLIQLAGASVPAGSSSSRSMQGGQAYSVAGGQAFGVAYLLDGAIHNNPFDNLNLPLPFPDALQEFKVETSSLTAQNGMHSGAAVNSVTRSGTNDIHGDLFEFLRNGDLNARNFFASRRDSLKRNQFGGTVGGPIKKNKLFYFAGYQDTITRQDPTETSTFIPTAQMVGGDFTTYESACNRGVVLKAPFVGNKLPASLLDKASLAIMSKLPTTTDVCGKILFGPVTQIGQYQVVSKVDYQLSTRHSLFGRYIATTYYQPPPYSLSPNPLATTIGGRDNLAQSISIGDTFLLSSTTVNSFRAAVNRTAIHRTSSNYFGSPDVGINNYSYLPHYMLVTMTPGAGFNLGGGTENEAIFRTTTYQLSDDVSMVRGSHSLAFGATLSQWRSAGYANVRSPGVFNFDGSATGATLADFMAGQLGGATAYLQSAPNTLIAREWYLGMYVQDTWKVTPRLTANFGVRWEPWFPQQLTNNAIYNFDIGRYKQGIRSTVFKNAPAGFLFPGDKGFQDQSGMNHKWLDLGPRVGLSWDPKGDGKMSIRASYGIAYDFVNGQFFINTANAPPWGSETRIPGPIPFDNPFNNSAGISNIFPIAFDVNAPFSLYGPFIALKPDQKTTAVHGWNLTVQRQFGSNWLLSASYIGSETEHLWVSTQLNPGVIVPSSSPIGTCPPGVTAGCNSTTNLNQRRALYLQDPNQGKYIGFLDQFDDGGTQSYNGVLLSVQRRLSKGVSANVNYTWSHCIGDFTQGGSTPNVGTGYLDPNNRRFDRGNCVSDRRHIFNLTVVAQTPRFSNNLVRAVGTGWQLGAIYRVTSGTPLAVTTTLDRQLSGTSGQRPVQILADPYCAQKTVGCWLNPNAFAQPALGTLGNMGPYNVFGPKFFEVDIALSRRFSILERLNMEIRGEAFNLTNSFRPGNTTTGASGLTTTLNSGTFGQVLNALDPRIMQVAVKFAF